MNELEKVELEIVKFLRGKYQLNEVALTCGGIPCVKFRQGSRTIVSIDLYKDHYVFQIVFGKTEQEKFEAERHEFSAFPQASSQYYKYRRSPRGRRSLCTPLYDLCSLYIVQHDKI